MPVYRQTYQQYTGAYLPTSLAWFIIAKKGIVKAWSLKWIKFLRFAFCSYFIISGIRVFMATNLDYLDELGFQVSQASQFIDIGDEFYMRFILFQIYILYFITLAICPSLIASDKRNKAITLYLSKSLSRFDYVFGKGFIPFAYLILATLVADFLLILLYALFDNDISYIFTNVMLFPKIFVFSMVVCIPLVLITLAISSLSSYAVTVSALLCCVYFLLPTVSRIFAEISIHSLVYDDPSSLIAILNRLLSDYEWWTFLSLYDMWTQVGHVIFGLEPPLAMPWILHAIMLLAICGVCAMVLYKQIKAVDVVK